MTFTENSEICEEAKNGRIDEVQQFLWAGVSINSMDQAGNNLLACIISCIYITKKRKLRLVERLLTLGANPNMLNELGETCLHTAVRVMLRGHVSRKIIKLLVKHGAAADVINNCGLMPHHIAYRGGDADMGDFLLFSDTPNFSAYPGTHDDEIYNLNENDYTEDQPRHLVARVATAPPEDLIGQLTSCDTNRGISLVENRTLCCKEKESEELECPICFDEYKVGDHIYKCYRCKKTFCGRCKRHDVMVNCPYCRADLSRHNCRDFQLESSLLQGYHPVHAVC